MSPSAEPTADVSRPVRAAPSVRRARRATVVHLTSVPISLAFTLIVSALSVKPSATHLAACFPDDRK